VPIEEAKYISIIGEIFVRRDHFALMGIPEMLAARNFVMLDVPVSEWLRYTDVLRETGMYSSRLSFSGKLELALTVLVEDWYERKVKRLFARTGLYEYDLIAIKDYLAHSLHFFPLELTGEPGLSSGAALRGLVDKYCGVISVGPFGCMNSRMTEAVAVQEMTVIGKEKAAALAGHPVDLSDLKTEMDVLPFLSVECDGNPFSQIIVARLETFMLQSDRLAAMLKKRKAKKALVQ
jgi:predicted nucleotide-binding protein (sugar kinase/HSP70/actin superfamily)